MVASARFINVKLSCTDCKSSLQRLLDVQAAAVYGYRARPTCVATGSLVQSSPENRKSAAAISRLTLSRICAAVESSTQSSSTSSAAAPKCTRPRATCVAVASYTTSYRRHVVVAVDCSEKTDSHVAVAV